MVLEFLESAARVATDPIGSITSAQGAIPALLPGAPFFLTRVRLRPSTRTGSFHHMLDGLRRSLVRSLRVGRGSSARQRLIGREPLQDVAGHFGDRVVVIVVR